MNKIKLSLLSLSVVLASFALASSVAAASLNISPETATLNPAQSLSTSVSVLTAGEKVCTVKGKVEFTNMVCSSITVSGDVMTQQAPTCQNPTFTIGLTKCATSDKQLFTMSVNAGNAGNGTVSFSGVTLIGEGTVIGSSSNSGSYTISTPVVVLPTNPTPAPEVTGSGNQDSTGGTTETEETVIDELPVENLDLSSPAAVSETGVASQLMSWVGTNLWWLILLALVAMGVVYYYMQKKKKQEPTV